MLVSAPCLLMDEALRSLVGKQPRDAGAELERRKSRDLSPAPDINRQSDPSQHTTKHLLTPTSSYTQQSICSVTNKMKLCRLCLPFNFLISAVAYFAW